jgi:hypothetical protein
MSQGDYSATTTTRWVIDQLVVDCAGPSDVACGPEIADAVHQSPRPRKPEPAATGSAGTAIVRIGTDQSGHNCLVLELAATAPEINGDDAWRPDATVTVPTSDELRSEAVTDPFGPHPADRPETLSPLPAQRSGDGPSDNVTLADYPTAIPPVRRTRRRRRLTEHPDPAAATPIQGGVTERPHTRLRRRLHPLRLHAREATPSNATRMSAWPPWAMPPSPVWPVSPGTTAAVRPQHPRRLLVASVVAAAVLLTVATAMTAQSPSAPTAEPSAATLAEAPFAGVTSLPSRPMTCRGDARFSPVDCVPYLYPASDVPLAATVAGACLSLIGIAAPALGVDTHAYAQDLATTTDSPQALTNAVYAQLSQARLPLANRLERDIEHPDPQLGAALDALDSAIRPAHLARCSDSID